MLLQRAVFRRIFVADLMAAVQALIIKRTISMKKYLLLPNSIKPNELSIIALFYLNLLSVKLPNNKRYFKKLPVDSKEALIWKMKNT